MKRATTILLGITFLLGIGSPAGAETVTVDPDDFAPGTDISNAVAGVTLATRSGNDTKVLALTSSEFSPNKVFGHSGDYPALWGGSDFEWLEARFDTPMKWVSLDFTPNDDDDSHPYLTAYEGSGVIQIAHVTTDADLTKGVPVTLMVSAPTAIITKIEASWDLTWCDNGELDNLQFDVVPEPSPIVVWSSIGLICGILCYRRKRRTAA